MPAVHFSDLSCNNKRECQKETVTLIEDIVTSNSKLNTFRLEANCLDSNIKYGQLQNRGIANYNNKLLLKRERDK